jgi:GT2 family glycosyltransferase
LERGALHFRNPKIAGVGGYFTSHEDGTTWEKLGYDLGWKRRNELTKAYVKDDYFSTINCIFRRTLWAIYPFDEKLPCEIPEARGFGGEDYDWAVEMQARGYQIIVEPEFAVYHSHGEKLNQLASKHIMWRQIRRKIKSFSRPRKAFTRLEKEKPMCIQV